MPNNVFIITFKADISLSINWALHRPAGYQEGLLYIIGLNLVTQILFVDTKMNNL